MNFFFRKAARTLGNGKVVVFGSNSTVGQPLSLLLKMCPHVDELVCCSTSLSGPASPSGVATDLSHIDTNAKVSYIHSQEQWPQAVQDARLVVVCSGNSFDVLPAYRDAALQVAAPEMRHIIDSIVSTSSKASIAIVSGPVNALTPYAAELLKRHSLFDPRKLFGVTTLDVHRTRTMVAEALDMNPFDVNVPVVGGRGGSTACALIAQTGLRVTPEEVVRISREVQQYGSPFVGVASAAEERTLPSVQSEEVAPVALSVAFAASDFIVSQLKAMRGDVGISEFTLVESSMFPETPFFSSRVELGREGVHRIHPMGKLTAYENELIEAALPEIAKDVAAGVAMARSSTIQ